MKFIVCVKQVPDTSEVEMNEETGTIIREGVPTTLNPFDEFALNEAVRIREQIGGEITALSMGPPQVEEALRKCLAIGADRAVLLTDSAFAGSDTWSTSYTLAEAIKVLGEFDLIYCGQQAVDGDTAQVGPELARLLGIPQLTYVEKIEELNEDYIICKKEVDEGYQRIKSSLPALVACMPAPDFQTRIPNVMDVMKAKKKSLLTWGKDDLAGDPEEYGLEGSPTQVIKVYPPPQTGEGIKIQESPEESAKKIYEFLDARGGGLIC